MIKRCISDTYFSTNIKEKIIAASAFKNICATYGEDSLSERTCRKWFTRFPEGNFNLSDENRPARPSDCNEKAIRDPLSKNTRQSTSELAEASGIRKSTIHYNLRNGCLTTMSYEKESGHCQVNPIKLSRRLDFIQRKPC